MKRIFAGRIRHSSIEARMKVMLVFEVGANIQKEAKISSVDLCGTRRTDP